MNRASGLLAIFAMATIMGPFPAVAQGAPILVDADQFRCLAEKISLVPAEAKGVYVNIRNCRGGGLRVVRHLVPPPRQLDSEGVESLLYLKPAQLRCISKHRRKLDRITQPAGNGRLRLMLDPCGR